MTAIQTRIQDYIREQLPKTVHLPDAGNDLPEPYSTPCVKEDFLFFFYWDTSFTNLGFYHIGMAEQARSNLLNMAYLIDKYGFMPNATPLTDRSQPPLFVRGRFRCANASGHAARVHLLDGEEDDALRAQPLPGPGYAASC